MRLGRFLNQLVSRAQRPLPAAVVRSRLAWDGRCAVSVFGANLPPLKGGTNPFAANATPTQRLEIGQSLSPFRFASSPIIPSPFSKTNWVGFDDFH